MVGRRRRSRDADDGAELSAAASSARRRRRAAWIEAAVVVGMLAGAAIIGVPRLVDAHSRARGDAACAAIRKLGTALADYSSRHGGAPARLNPNTLEPLVQARSLRPAEARAILATLEDGRLSFFWGSDAAAWEYDYVIGFRPRGEADPTARYYLLPQGAWRWDAAGGWHRDS